MRHRRHSSSGKEVQPKQEFPNNVGPSIKIQKKIKERKLIFCDHHHVEQSIIRFCSPITHKVYVRTFSGGAKIPINIDKGSRVPTRMTELKEFLRLSRPITPVQVSSINYHYTRKHKTKRREDFNKGYNSKNDNGTSHKINSDSKVRDKLPVIVHPITTDKLYQKCCFHNWDAQEPVKLPPLNNGYGNSNTAKKKMRNDETENAQGNRHNQRMDCKKLMSEDYLKFPLIHETTHCRQRSRHDRQRNKTFMRMNSKINRQPFKPADTNSAEHHIENDEHKACIIGFDEHEKKTTNERPKLSAERHRHISRVIYGVKPVDEDNSTTTTWKMVSGSNPSLVEVHYLKAALNERYSDGVLQTSSQNKLITKSRFIPMVKATSQKIQSMCALPNEAREAEKRPSQRMPVARRKPMSPENTRKMTLNHNHTRKRDIERTCHNKEVADDKAMIVKTMVEKVKSASRDDMLSGVEEAVRLSCDVPHLVEPYMKCVYRALIILLRSLQTGVVSIACHAATELFKNVKSSSRPEFDEIGGILVHKTADMNKFIREEANYALDSMVTYITPLSTIRVLVEKGVNHKNMLVRIAVARLITCIVAITGPENILGKKTAKETRQKILQTTAKFLDDCNLETRSYAQKLYKELLQYDEFEELFHSDVDRSAIRRIEKTMIKLKYDNGSSCSDDESYS